MSHGFRFRPRALGMFFLPILSFSVLLSTGAARADVSDLLCRQGSLTTTVRGNANVADGTTVQIFNENNVQIAPPGAVVVDGRFLVSVPNADPNSPSVGEALDVDVTGCDLVTGVVQPLTNFQILLGTFFCDPIDECVEPVTADQLGFERGHVDPGNLQSVRVYLERPPGVGAGLLAARFAVAMTANLNFEFLSDTYCGLVAGGFPNIRYTLGGCPAQTIAPIMEMDIDATGAGVLDILPMMLDNPQEESLVVLCDNVEYVLGAEDVAYMTFYGDTPDCNPVSVEEESWGAVKSRYR